MPESCQQKTPASGCPLDTPSLPFPSRKRFLHFPCYLRRVQYSRTLPAKSGTCFNRRTREGCDPENSKGEYSQIVSSTHPRGVRQVNFTCKVVKIGFQSTHPRGVRRFLHPAIRTMYTRFNPRTREGCDSLPRLICTAEYGFSSNAPARGATVRYAKRTE